MACRDSGKGARFHWREGREGKKGDRLDHEQRREKGGGGGAGVEVRRQAKIKIQRDKGERG